MKRVVLRWVFTILSLPLRLSGGMADSFGFTDERIAQRHAAKLLCDVEKELPFLFAEENAHTVPRDGAAAPPAFDYASVTVALDSMLLRFCRGRGELTVYAAPVFAPAEWHELSLVLNVATDGESIKREGYSDLWQVSRLLRTHLNVLRDALSLARFEVIKRRLDEVYSRDQVAIQRWETETNRRLYGR